MCSFDYKVNEFLLRAIMYRKDSYHFAQVLYASDVFLVP